MASLGELLVKVGADIGDFQKDMGTVTKTLDGVGRNFDNMSGRLTDAGTALTASLTVPLVGVGAASTAAYMQFEQAMAGVRSVSTLTGAELDMLKGKALQLGQQTKYSATDAAQGMKELAAAGFNVSQVMAAAGPTLDLAAAGEIAVSEAAETAANTLGQFQLKASDMGMVADVLVLSANSAQTSVRDLSEAMKYSGGLANAAGIDFTTTSAALAIMSESGLKGSMAGTALSAALREMLNPSTKQAEVMERLGISFTDANGKMLPFSDIIETVKTKVTNTTDRVVLFGTEGMRAMESLASSKTSLEGFTTQLNNSEGAAKKAADTLNNTLTGRLEAFKGSVETAGIKIGEALAPAINSLLTLFTDLANKAVAVAQWFGQLPTPIQNITLGILALVAAVGPLLLALGGISSVLGSLATLPGAATAALAALKTGFVGMGSVLTGVAAPALSTVALALGAVAAVIATLMIGKWAYDNFEPFRTLVNTVGEAIKTIFVYHLEVAKAVLNSLGLVIIGVVQTGLNFIAWLRSIPVVGKIVDAVIEGFKLGFQGVTKVIELVTNGFKWLIDKLKAFNKDYDVIGKTMDKVKGSFSSTTAEVKKLNPEIKTATTNAKDLDTPLKNVDANVKAIETSLKNQTAQFKSNHAEMGTHKTHLDEVKTKSTAAATESEKLAQSIFDLSTKINNSKPSFDTLATDLEKAATKVQGVETAATTMKNNAPPAFALVSTAAGDMVADTSTALDNPTTGTSAWGQKITTFADNAKTTIGNFATDIGKSLFDGNLSWGEKFKSMIGSLSTMLKDTFITPATTALQGMLSGVLTDMIGAKGFGGIGSAITDAWDNFKGFLDFGSSAASGAASAASGAGQAAAGAGSAGGLGSSVGSVASSGLMATLGAIGSLGSMVSGFIGNFQNAKQETTLNAIEESTRYTKGYLRDLLPALVNDYAVNLPAMNDRLFEMRQYGIPVWSAAGSSINITGFEYQLEFAEQSRNYLKTMSTTPRTINVEINGITDPEKVAQTVMDKIAAEWSKG